VEGLEFVVVEVTNFRLVVVMEFALPLMLLLTPSAVCPERSLQRSREIAIIELYTHAPRTLTDTAGMNCRPGIECSTNFTWTGQR